MRVHERGSGETRSCGTGAVAAAAAAAVAAASQPPDAPGLPPDAASPVAGASLSDSPAGPPDGAAGSPDSVGQPNDAGPPDGPAGSPDSAPPAPGGDAPAVCPPAGIWIVDLPGGRLRVTFDGRTSFLSGPAVIVAEGELDESWLSGKPAIPAQSSPAP